MFRKIVFYMFSSLILTACSSKSIKEVRIFYLPESTNTSNPVSCGKDIFRHKILLLNKTINDKIFLKNFSKFFIKLENDTSQRYEDIRIECLVYYVDKEKVDTLCFGELTGIFLNNSKVKDDSVFLNYIKEQIYPSPSIFELLQKKDNDSLSE